LFGWLAAAAAAAPEFDPSWSHLSTATEIPELRTPTSRTYRNGDGTFTAEVRPASVPASSRASAAVRSRNGADSLAVSGTGYVYYYSYHGLDYYYKHGPDMIYRLLGGYEESWAKFDLSSVPDGSLVRAATLSWYQYEVFSSHIATTVRRALVEPDSGTAEALFNAIDHGTVEAPSQTHNGIGWVNRPLNEMGIAHIASCLVQDWIAFGIREDNYAEGAHAYGIEGGDYAPYLRVTYVAPTEPDIQAVRAKLLTWPAVARGSDTAQLVLANSGLHGSGQFWAYATTQGPNRESAAVATVAVGETDSIALPLPSTTKSDTFLPNHLWSACTTDPWTFNDTTQLRCWVYPAHTYAVEGFDRPGFPPPGWIVVNNDGGDQSWQRQTDPRVVHSEAGCATCLRDTNQLNDDWLIYGPICPEDGDSLGFYFRAYRPSSNLILQVWAMRGQHISDTFKTLTGAGVSDTIYYRRSAWLGSLAGQTLYVGFRCMWYGEWRGLCLDDIWFSGFRAPGTHEPGTVVASPPGFSIEPDPTSGRFATIRYETAAGTQSKLTMRDVVGRTIRTCALDKSGISSLDLRGLPSGVYMATLEARTQSLTRKLVITTH
jgi:hypothetical protein